MTEGSHPRLTREEVIARTRAAAGRGLDVTKKAENELIGYGYDLEEVEDILIVCTDPQLHEHHVSENYPEFNDYIAIFKIRLEGERHPFYIKIAIYLPDMENAELISFHEWGLYR